MNANIKLPIKPVMKDIAAKIFKNMRMEITIYFIEYPFVIRGLMPQHTAIPSFQRDFNDISFHLNRYSKKLKESSM